ncbi:hypothetical protein Zmor_003765 [Zophobas morio]|uniref:PiggyBac transposable element-derived protein domain-containing protein n=1 Tax=Zophobas morio TaxID=2755281 RepID=A0AA38HMR1_9CUCU|nr:hypothetical protein Zmor_003765 [Zophobas morio]
MQDIYLQFGSGAGTVMQLAERINENYHGLYFDNYFSSYHLFQYLNSKGVMAIGTIRANRFCKPKLVEDKEMKKKGRGACDVSVSKDGVVITKWFDNKPIMVASNFIAVGNKDNCQRWDKKNKMYIEIPRPEAIALYNGNMGGVDKVDFLLSIYRSYRRSRKWTVRMISHAVDLALVNSWLEYRQHAAQLGLPKKKILDLWSFRQSVAEHLILFKERPKRGRPSAETEQTTPPRKRKTETRPHIEARFVGYEHYPLVDNKKEATRCKMEKCKGKSHTICTKCDVHLCLQKDRNCFLNFHKI